MAAALSAIVEIAQHHRMMQRRGEQIAELPSA